MKKHGFYRGVSAETSPATIVGIRVYVCWKIYLFDFKFLFHIQLFSVHVVEFIL